MISKGVFFGSFDPIHNGHLEIANYFLNQNLINEVIFMVTPKNPLKLEKDKNSFTDRYKLVELGIKGYSKIKSSDIENKLPKPNYTYYTLEYLKKTSPEIEYIFLMGSDLLQNFKGWKKYIEILNNHKIFVYPRNNSVIPSEFKSHKNIKFFKANLIQISSTLIRENIKNNLSIKDLVPSAVNNFLTENNSHKD